jgi:hypothetical protein
MSEKAKALDSRLMLFGCSLIDLASTSDDDEPRWAVTTLRDLGENICYGYTLGEIECAVRTIENLNKYYGFDIKFRAYES